MVIYYYVASVIAVLVTFIVTLFVAGRKYGRLEEKVNMLIDLDGRFRSLESKFNLVSRDVSEIKGMFGLRLKEGGND
jgi:hypothetical protein